MVKEDLPGRRSWRPSGKRYPNRTGLSCALNLQFARNDFYQTPSTVIASFYLKKIDKSKAKVDFSSPKTVELDLPTADSKRYTVTLPLFGAIDVKASQFKIMGTKLELTLAKADGASWPVLRSDDQQVGEIIQVGRAGRA